MHQTPLSRFRRAAVALAMALALPGAAAAQTGYPNRPVRLVLGFGTGGVADISSRLVAEHLEARFGVRFVVENVPGSGGTVATQQAFQSDNEGYTLLNMGNAATIRRTTMPNLRPDQIDDFVPVSTIAEFGLIVVTAPDSPFQTLEELVAHAQANPDTLNLGSVVVGSTQNLAAILFATVAGIDVEVIPFTSSPEVMGATARGEVDAAFEIIAGARNAIESGQVRALATTMSRRSALYPDLPTVEESGVAPFDVSSWNGFVSRNGTPPEVVELLHTEIQRILALPEVRERMLEFGMEPYIGSIQDMRDRQMADVERWRAVILAAGIPIEE